MKYQHHEKPQDKARSFYGNLNTLAATTLVMYVVTMLATPVVTRLYSPEDFGLYNIYVSLLCVILIPAMLRLEASLAITQSNQEISERCRVCYAILCISVALLSLLVVLAPCFELPLAISLVGPYLPLGLYGAGVMLIAISLAVRTGSVARANHFQLRQQVGSVVSQVALGAMGIQTFGLMLSDAIGRNWQNLPTILRIGVYDRLDGYLTATQMCRTIVTLWRYPVFLMPGALFRYSISYSVPIIVYSAYGGGPAGHLALAQRLAGMPRTLLGNAINYILTSEAHVASGEGALRNYLQTSRRVLLIIGLAVLLIAAAVQALAGLIFGSEWEEVGLLVSLLSTYYLLDAYNHSMGSILQVRGLLNVSLVSDIAVAASQLVGLGVALKLNLIFIDTILIYGCVGAFSLFAAIILQSVLIRRTFSGASILY